MKTTHDLLQEFFCDVGETIYRVEVPVTPDRTAYVSMYVTTPPSVDETKNDVVDIDQVLQDSRHASDFVAMTKYACERLSLNAQQVMSDAEYRYRFAVAALLCQMLTDLAEAAAFAVPVRMSREFVGALVAAQFVSPTCLALPGTLAKHGMPVASFICDTYRAMLLHPNLTDKMGYDERNLEFVATRALREIVVSLNRRQATRTLPDIATAWLSDVALDRVRCARITPLDALPILYKYRPVARVPMSNKFVRERFARAIVELFCQRHPQISRRDCEGFWARRNRKRMGPIVLALVRAVAMGDHASYRVQRFTEACCTLVRSVVPKRHTKELPSPREIEAQCTDIFDRLYEVRRRKGPTRADGLRYGLEHIAFGKLCPVGYASRTTCT
ncbi:MAG: hypothetical protein MHM6MM_003649 [Cercozoa sp. M6MM]